MNIKTKCKSLATKQKMRMEKEEDITMKKTYKIEVDCAACALKMEDAAKKVEGVTDATVSFMTQKMKVEFADGLPKTVNF